MFKCWLIQSNEPNWWYIKYLGLVWKCVRNILLIRFYVICSFKMIGFAQGREPGVSRRVIATLDSIVNAPIISLSSAAASFVSSNCLESVYNLEEASCNFLSLCAPFDNEIEVLDSVGSLNASAQISQSAWSQWNVVRQIIATTQKR